jgi:GntR family transcriptional regulator of arabinose operon
MANSRTDSAEKSKKQQGLPENRPSLLGRPIFDPSEGLTLTSQVREILLEEILSGRWQPGDRLPSVAALAQKSGLSRWPIQEAFETLRNEGYLRQSERSGTFLESMNPRGHSPLGTVGIAMLLREDHQRWSTTPYSEYRLSRVLAVAEERRYAAEIKYLRPEDDWSQLDRAGGRGVFGEHVMGVISLYPFPHAPKDTLTPNDLPFVHLGSNSHVCLPTVAGDTITGFYRMTRRVIEEGHRDIICLCDPSDTEWETRGRLLGHERAMREAGLEVNYAACERSRTLAEGDLSALRAFVDEFRSATAVVCMWGMVSAQLVEVAEMMGIRVPDHLSITAHGASTMGSRRDLIMTHLEYDMDALVHTCFDLLAEQESTRRTHRTLVLGSARVREGASLKPPADEDVLARIGRGPRRAIGFRV